MSRVSEAMASIDEALRLGNITEEDADKLKNKLFTNKQEFEDLYNLVVSLNSIGCNTEALKNL